MLLTGPVACVLLSLLTSNADSRHIYRHRQLHREYARQHGRELAARDAAALSSLTSSQGTVASEGKAVLHDLEQVDAGLHSLPKDFSQFFNAVEGLEKLLKSLLSISGSGTQTADVAPITASSAARMAFTTQQQLTTTMTRSHTTSVMCYVPSPNGHSVPCNGISQQTQTSAVAVETSPASSTCYVPGLNGGPTPCSSISQITTTPILPVSTLARTAPYPYSNQTGTRYPNASGARYTGITTLQASPTKPSGSNSAMYTFNARATDNVAVYYGQTAGTTTKGLLSLCQDVNVDIVILAFVYDFFGTGGYPSAEFGPSCWSSSNPKAPGLANCSALAPEVESCQRVGKKVLVSIGGAVGNSTISSASQAKAFATTLWNLFGNGTDDQALRPFGPDVIVDGFDIDNENHDAAHYSTLAAALRNHFASDSSNIYYLSAAPQCPIPDASIPTGVLYDADFVWVQFYNNPSCNLGSSGFQSSFKAWAQSLRGGSGERGWPRLFIGAPAAPFAAGSGYVAPTNLSTVVDQVLRLNVGNLGGIMLWDGTDAMMNSNNATGANYLQYAKSALQL